MTTNERRPLTADAPTPYTPVVVHFKGRLGMIEDRDVERDGRTRRQVTFKHVEIEAFETTAPYTFPIFDVQINYSQAQDQPWSVFTESFRQLAPDNNLDLYQLEGKVCEWKWSDCKLSRPVSQGSREFALQDAKAWKLVSVEGWSAEGTETYNLDELILELLNGKTANEFSQAYYSDNRVRSTPGYEAATEKLAKGTLLSELEAAGKVTRDDEGRYIVNA